MADMTAAQRRKLFKLANERGIDEEMLHALVYSLAKKNSIKELTIMEAVKVIDSLEGNSKNADNMISSRQLKYIKGLAKELGWVEADGRTDEKALNGFIEKKYGISNINWLDSKKASFVIEGMKAIKKRDENVV